jgi:hypothetical protein
MQKRVDIQGELSLIEWHRWQIHVTLAQSVSPLLKMRVDNMEANGMGTVRQALNPKGAISIRDQWLGGLQLCLQDVSRHVAWEGPRHVPQGL